MDTPVSSSPGPVRAESDESSVPVAKEVSLGKPAAYPPRTLAHPFVTANPVTAAPIALEAARDSCVVQGTLFQIETMDKPLYDYALPFDDMIPINTYVGDWEELYIRTYHRVFADRDHVIYWGKSELGVFVTCVGRAVEDIGHPTLSVGPNGFHFARLPHSEGHDFPTPKGLAKLFPHFEECKFVYANHAEKLAFELSSFEQKMKPTRYKFGVLYMKEGQTEENDIYGNLDGSRGFVSFLSLIGDMVELSKHKQYRGGLDCSGADTTGHLSVYTRVSLFDGRISSKVIAEAIEVVELVKEKKEEGKKRKLSKEQEIMLHVAPFLPHSSEQEDGNQQLHKKRHLGNDICVVIYKEGNTKLNPEVFKSQFNHVYIIVTPCVSPSGEELFKVEVVTKGLKRFLPTLPSNNVLSATQLREWLLLKLINGEVAAMNAKDLRLKMKRTRTQTLESWAKTHMGDGNAQSAHVIAKKK